MSVCVYVCDVEVSECVCATCVCVCLCSCQCVHWAICALLKGVSVVVCVCVCVCVCVSPCVRRLTLVGAQHGDPVPRDAQQQEPQPRVPRREQVLTPGEDLQHNNQSEQSRC